MQLTMASAIARSGADPWQEAARISKMPRDAALRVLARFVPEAAEHGAGASTGQMPIEALFALLPVRASLVAPLAKRGTDIERIVFVIAALLIAAVVSVPILTHKNVGGAANGKGDSPTPPISSDSRR